jgi:hypothetical protein
MLEHLTTADEYAAARDFIADKGQGLGLRFE